MKKIVNGELVDLTQDDIDFLASRESDYVQNKFSYERDSFEFAIKDLLLKTAKSKDYDSEFSIVSYANSTNMTWKAEALAFIAWRDLIYDYVLTEFEKFTNNILELPNVNDFIAELPTITWPS